MIVVRMSSTQRRPNMPTPMSPATWILIKFRPSLHTKLD